MKKFKESFSNNPLGAEDQFDKYKNVTNSGYLYSKKFVKEIKKKWAKQCKLEIELLKNPSY